VAVGLLVAVVNVLPRLVLPTLPLPHLALPDWAGEAFQALRPVRRAVLALLVLGAAYGEYARRRRALRPAPDDQAASRPADVEQADEDGRR